MWFYFLNILFTRIRTHSWDSLKSSTQCWTSFENSSSEIRPPTRSLFKISFFVTDKSLSSEPRSLVNPGSIMFHTASAWWTWIKSLITSLDIFKTPNQFLHHFLCMHAECAFLLFCYCDDKFVHANLSPSTMSTTMLPTWGLPLHIAVSSAEAPPGVSVQGLFHKLQ